MGDEKSYDGQIKPLILNTWAPIPSTSQNNFKNCPAIGQDILI